MYSEPQSQFLTPEQVAARLGLSVRSVRERVYRGTWPHLRLDGRTIRFTEEQFKEIVDSSSRFGKSASTLDARRDAGKELAALLSGRR